MWCCPWAKTPHIEQVQVFLWLAPDFPSQAVVGKPFQISLGVPSSRKLSCIPLTPCPVTVWSQGHHCCTATPGRGDMSLSSLAPMPGQGDGHCTYRLTDGTNE